MAEGNTEELTQHDIFNVWRKIINLTIPEFGLFIGAIITALCTSICDFLSPMFLGKAMDIVHSNFNSTAPSIPLSKEYPLGDLSKEVLSQQQDNGYHALNMIFLVIIAIQIIRATLEYARERINNNIGDFVRQRAQEVYTHNVLYCEVAYFDASHTSELNKMVSNLLVQKI